MRGGIGFTWRLGAGGTLGLGSRWILSLEPERLKKPMDTAPLFLQEDVDLVARDAQAACGFSCSPSKCAPFFQTIKMIAAILRAKVRRAIEGSIPFARRFS